MLSRHLADPREEVRRRGRVDPILDQHDGPQAQLEEELSILAGAGGGTNEARGSGRGPSRRKCRPHQGGRRPARVSIERPIVIRDGRIRPNWIWRGGEVYEELRPP